jgi:hypothetical protein
MFLEIFAVKFKKWHGNRRYLRYSSHFLEEINRLIHHFDIAFDKWYNY